MEEKNWIQEMIKRESTPKPARKETIEEFCKQWEISEATYHYQKSKKENKKNIVKIWLSEAMDDGNEVLKKLRDKAKTGDNKAMELYLKFVLELAENLDIKSDDKPLGVIAYPVKDVYEIPLETNTSTDTSTTG